MAGSPRFWRPGRLQHLQISLPSLHAEELEAFPEMVCDSVQLTVDQSPDWHSDLHSPSFHTEYRRPMEHQACSPRLVFPLQSEPPSYGNMHIHDWYSLD